MTLANDTIDTQVRDEEWDAVLVSKTLEDLSKCLSTDLSRGQYPDPLMLMLWVLSRAARSQNKMLKRLENGAWSSVRAVYTRRFRPAIPLPLRPPTAEMLDGFGRRLSHNTELMDALEEAFTQSSCQMARALGLFAPADADYAHPSIEHAVFGDGTYIKPFSEVRAVIDPASQTRRYVGSRSKSGRPRLQAVRTNSARDHKTAVGVNHVSVSAWSPYGWIVLATGQAFQAESERARDLLGRVHRYLGDGLHHVVWDRALTGWISEWAMQELHASVINKAVALGDRKRTEPNLVLPQAEVIARFERGEPLPLGATVYPRGEGEHWFVRSAYHRVGQPPGVFGCAHDLYVDDGALVDTVLQGPGRRFKTAVVTALTSTGRMVNGRWNVTTRWFLPCQESPDGGHQFETELCPRSKKEQRFVGDLHRALSHAYAVPRIDTARFAPIGHMRNLTESLNMWMKSRIGKGGNGRAHHLDIRVQRLDHLCLGMLANAVTQVSFQKGSAP